jgi:dethiobiotin synthetase
MLQPIFITGIGTDVGKTIVSAIIAEALHADYWKPVQAGNENGTDGEWVQKMLTNSVSKIHQETYKLKLAASPHIAAREEGVKIDLDTIKEDFFEIRNKNLEIRNQEIEVGQRPSISNHHLIIEGAGGLLVPLNEKQFVIDLIKKLQAKVILVSRNYLGSINHSLLTAAVCRQNNIDVIGWIFSDQYLSYEDEIVRWSGFPKIASIPFSEKIDKEFISLQANACKASLLKL